MWHQLRPADTAPLTAGELALVLGVASLIFMAVEAEKWVKRVRSTGARPLARAGGAPA